MRVCIHPAASWPWRGCRAGGAQTISRPSSLCQVPANNIHQNTRGTLNVPGLGFLPRPYPDYKTDVVHEIWPRLRLRAFALEVAKLLTTYVGGAKEQEAGSEERAVVVVLDRGGTRIRRGPRPEPHCNSFMIVAPCMSNIFSKPYMCVCVCICIVASMRACAPAPRPSIHNIIRH
jgi:hypothetical protein